MTTLQCLVDTLMATVPSNLYRPLAPATHRLIAELRRVRRRANANRIGALLAAVETGEFDPRCSTRAFPIADLARALERCGLHRLALAARRGRYGAPRLRRAYVPAPVGTPRRATRCK